MIADPDIAVVIVNYNGAAWLQRCLPSVLAAEPAPAEVIVADDGSIDDSGAVARDAGVRFVSNAGPRGWAGNSNSGIAAARSEWILLLNNDIEVSPDVFERLAEAIEAHPDAAFISPLVRSLQDTALIDSAGLLLFPDGTGRPRWHGMSFPGPDSPVGQIAAPSGAAVLLSRAWLAKVGAFDHRFGMYCEDLDWGLRCSRLGGTGHLARRAEIFHHFSGTMGALTPRKAWFVERNRVVVAVRHLPAKMLIASPLWTVRRWRLLGSVVSHSRTPVRAAGRVRMAAYALGGALAGLFRAPRAFTERRRLRKRAVVTGPPYELLLAANTATEDDMRAFGARVGTQRV